MAEIQIEFDVPAEMRDGTVLRADVYRPGGAGPWPVLLSRLPYGKQTPMIGVVLDPLAAAHLPVVARSGRSGSPIPGGARRSGRIRQPGGGSGGGVGAGWSVWFQSPWKLSRASARTATC